MFGMSLLVLIVALVCLAHVALAAVALLVLVATPSSRLAMSKWIWALVIVFGHTVGPIAFLVVGRQRREHWAPMPTDRDARPYRYQP